MKWIALTFVLVTACGKSDSAKPSDDPAATPAPTTTERGSGGRKHFGSGDGKTDEERAAGRRKRLEEMRTKLDTNGDGKLSPDELAKSDGRMKFDDPAALDTDHDGDISVDELEAAMKARRGTRHHDDDGAGGGSAAGSSE